MAGEWFAQRSLSPARPSAASARPERSVPGVHEVFAYRAPMKFGLMFTNTGIGKSGAGALDLATRADRLGFESLWTVEHVVVPSGYQSAYPYDKSGKMAGGAEEFDLPDPLIWLAFVASATARIRLATGVLIVPQRNPLILAKEVATLDALSGGRVTLGVGVGWLEEEFNALGVPFADRGRRLDDYVEALRALWTQSKASVHNTYTSFDDCISRPFPANGTVPIVVGGHSPAAARRAARLGDGFFPGNGSVADVAAVFETFRAAC
ncbi:MAG: putative F420-dependent oxidoreductase, Rv2161c family, partial [Ilumatobacteraceae bacterium]|nr:putative F420-dependent oxidoreductase, Rv2161c family [Ilumatobacteraceae bacterium]